jgi:hypothetical protein
MRINKMDIKIIYKVVKASMVKDSTIEDMKIDKEATAWQYASLKLKDYPVLKTIDDIKNDNGKYNQLFMDHYSKALKVLRG